MYIISAKDFLLWKKKQLSKGSNIQSFDLLIEIVGGITREEINLISFELKEKFHLKRSINFLEDIWERHVFNCVPIQHLCGYTFWRNLKLKVSENVLIPRPETELIVDIVVNLFKKDYKKLFFAELGTGSGAIGIALALDNPSWEGIATDIDKASIELAKTNFINSTNQSNLRFYCGNWWKPLEDFKGALDLVISNPPYIPEKTYRNLPKSVKNFEPEIALTGGEDGLDHIREIIQYAPHYLKLNGCLLIEHHFDQGNKVRQLFLEKGFSSVEVLKDLSGIGRFTIGRYK